MDISIVNIIFMIIILAISIGLHEYAHAWASYSLGDPTPKLQGRLTPNPVAHIDPIGFLMIFIIHFGRGKPVEVNPMYYKRPVRDELIVALAGPFTNIVLAVIGITILIINIGYMQTTGNDMISQFWTLFGYINISLAIFNMIPLPPLDGFRLVKFFTPKLGEIIDRYKFQISIGFLLLILVENNTNLSIIGPFITTVSGTIFNTIYAIIHTILL